MFSVPIPDVDPVIVTAAPSKLTAFAVTEPIEISPELARMVKLRAPPDVLILPEKVSEVPLSTVFWFNTTLSP